MLALTLLLLFASAFAFVPRTDKPYYSLDDAEKHFEDFIDTFDVNYSSEMEKQMRFEVFKENLEEINQMNSDPEQPAEFGITRFSDLTKEEFRAKYTGFRFEGVSPFDNEPTSVPTRDLPENFDWRDKNVVTPVKNQDPSNTCWAFSTTGTVEGAYALKHGKLLSFSEQQLVDCDTSDGGLMNGGNSVTALQYLQKYGAESEEDYPYTQMNESCAYDASKVKANITEQIDIPFDNDYVVQQMLVEHGPISFSLNGDYLQHHKEQILHGYDMPSNDCGKCANHAVLLVGYGTENGVPYWLVKNSWGLGFGIDGYFKLMREPNKNPLDMRCYGGVMAKVA